MSEEKSHPEQEENGTGSIQDGIFNLVISLHVQLSQSVGKESASEYVVHYLQSLIQGLSTPSNEQQESDT